MQKKELIWYLSHGFKENREIKSIVSKITSDETTHASRIINYKKKFYEDSI